MSLSHKRRLHRLQILVGLVNDFDGNRIARPESTPGRKMPNWTTLGDISSAPNVFIER